MKLSPAFRVAVASTMFALRSHRGVTQDQMAQLAGVDQATLSRIERALCMPSIAMVWHVGCVAHFELREVAGIIAEVFEHAPETIEEGREIAMAIIETQGRGRP